MGVTTVTLWLVRETAKARLYSKLRPDRNPGPEDELWVPLSIIEHVTKRGNEHQVTVPDWFVEKNGL